jgi:hypothetical protein
MPKALAMKISHRVAEHPEVADDECRASYQHSWKRREDQRS